MLFVSLYYGRRLACGSKPRDPTKFHITAYVLPDTNKFEQDPRVVEERDSSVRSSSIALKLRSRSSVGSTSSGGSSSQEMSDLDLHRAQIQEHLTGHGRIRRGFWKEIWMFVKDYDWEKMERETSEV